MYTFRERLDTEKARRRVWFLFSVSRLSVGTYLSVVDSLPTGGARPDKGNVNLDGLMAVLSYPRVLRFLV